MAVNVLISSIITALCVLFQRLHSENLLHMYFSMRPRQEIFSPLHLVSWARHVMSTSVSQPS